MDWALCIGCGKRVECPGRRGLDVREWPCPACAELMLVGWRQPTAGQPKHCSLCGRELHAVEVPAGNDAARCLACQRAERVPATGEKVARAGATGEGRGRREES